MWKRVYAICEQQRRRSVCMMRSLISAFVFRCLDNMMPLVSISEISSLYLASVAAQAGLCLTWLKIPKTGFLVTWLICSHIFRAFVDQSAATMHLPAKIGEKTQNIFTIVYPVSLYANKRRARIVYTLKTGLIPTIIYYWPFQGGASVVVYSKILSFFVHLLLVFDQLFIFMLPTSKKLEGHIAFGFSVRPSVMLFDACHIL